MKMARGAGNYGTAATWGTVANTPSHHASAIVTLSGTSIYTATFTAPNIINSLEAIGLVLTRPGTATINVWLQVGGVDTSLSPIAQLVTNQGTNTNGAGLFRLAFTPILYTTTVANSYRFRITATGITTAPQLAADSGGTLPMFYAADDRTGTPSNEAVQVCDYTVTVNGSVSAGWTGADTTALSSTLIRYEGLGIHVGQNGVLEWDYAASATLTCMGHPYASANGIIRATGSAGARYPTAYTATLIIDQNGATGQYGFYTTPNASFIMQGRQISNRKTKYVAGLGTAASPMQVYHSVADYAVGDEIAVSGGAYNESEKRFIITINPTGTLVLSNTAGGAEAALVYTHTANHEIANLTANVIITTNNSSYSLYGYNAPSANNLVDVDDIRVEYAGVAGVGGKQGIFVSNNGGAGLTSTYGSWDNCVAYIPRYCGFVFQNTQTAQTFSGLIVYGGTNVSGPTQGGAFAFLANASNKTFNDCLAINMGIPGLAITTPTNITVNRMGLWNCNTGNSSLTGAIYTAGPSQITLNDCSVQGSRLNGIMFNGGNDLLFNNFHCGDYATNTIDLAFTSASTNKGHFERPYFGSATVASGYLTQGTGSKITMQSVNGVQYDHRVYTSNGRRITSGSGLADTTTRRTGKYSWCFIAEAAAGDSWEYYKYSEPDYPIIGSGFIFCNSAFVSDATASITVDLFLPGSTTPDDTVTLTKTTDAMSGDAFYNLSAVYTGDYPLMTRVRITIAATAVGAYAYLADIDGGSNELNDLSTWFKGEPASIMYEEKGDNMGPLAVPTEAAAAIPGSVGEHIVNIAKFDDQILLKLFKR